MDLSSVTTLGVIVFAGLKFAGYILAFFWLKKLQPDIQAHAWRMAAARTLLGVLAGGGLYLVWYVARHRIYAFYNFSFEFWPYYLILAFLRVLIWAAVIYFFSRSARLEPRKIWLYAAGGTILSCAFDVPATFFTMFVPGAVLFC